jgi:proteic killer suppression protein
MKAMLVMVLILPFFLTEYPRRNSFCAVIGSFAQREAELLFHDKSVRRFAAIERVARRKMLLLHAAARLDDLRVPPGNRLEALKGDRAGLHSIRVNDQWRICFIWKEGEAHDVEIVDYH